VAVHAHVLTPESRADESGRQLAVRAGETPAPQPEAGGHSGLVMTPQAMRAGAALPFVPEEAWMTMEVPPLLKTELASLPRVTLGAMVVACAVPSWPTTSAKSGISPAGGISWEWPMPEGSKCAPADLKSGGSHLAN